MTRAWLLVGTYLTIVLPACGGTSEDRTSPTGSGGASGSGGGGASGSGGGGESGSGGGGESGSGGGGESGSGGGGESGSGGGGESGSGGGATTTACGEFAACGGDPVGDWALVEFCNLDPNDFIDDPALNDPACEGVFDSWDLDIDETLSFRADGTTSMTASGSIAFDLEFVPQCVEVMVERPLNDGEFELFCEAMDTDLSDPAMAETMYGSCSVTLGSCQCHVEEPMPGSAQSGTYTVDGNTLVDEGGDASDFCVRGDILTLGAPDSPSGEAMYAIYRRVGD